MAPQKKAHPGLILILIALVFIGPFLFAYTLYQRNQSGEFQTKNHGELLSPPLAIQSWEWKNSEVDSAHHFEKKWWLVYLAPETCDKACQHFAHQLKQVHVSLGKEHSRLNRLWLQTSEHNLLTQEVQQLAPGFQSLELADATLATLALYTSPTTRALYGDAFIVDPLGNVILYYPGDTNPMGILKDLKHLLKISNIG